MRRRNLVSVLILLLLFSNCRSKEDAKVSESQKITNERVFDQIGLLKDSESDKLTALILELERNAGSQIAILIVDTLNGEKLEEFSLKAFEKMNLGSSERDDGILIVQSFRDRKIRIEVGYGLEKIIKDEIAARINREMIIPKFREDKYFDGFYEAVSEIKILIEANKDLIGERL